ncbi:MAG: hypothetical protein AABY22_33520, partial [Nanoarchaeota archaeon]
ILMAYKGRKDRRKVYERFEWERSDFVIDRRVGWVECFRGNLRRDTPISRQFYLVDSTDLDKPEHSLTKREFRKKMIERDPMIIIPDGTRLRFSTMDDFELIENYRLDTRKLKLARRQ